MATIEENIKVAIEESCRTDWFIFLQCDNLVGRVTELKDRNVIWDVNSLPKARRFRDVIERVHINQSHELYSVWKNCKDHIFVSYKGNYHLLPTNSFVFFGKGVELVELNCKRKFVL